MKLIENTKPITFHKVLTRRIRWQVLIGNALLPAQFRHPGECVKVLEEIPEKDWGDLRFISPTGVAVDYRGLLTLVRNYHASNS